jgi:arginine decarboxylase
MDPLPFHMPGHKLGKGIPDFFLQNVASLDITEIPGTDNLHEPSGPIKEALELAALAFGSDRTFFLVNGSTCGIHAMITAMCRPGQKLIVTRDCHKAVVGGMILAGAEPVFIMPELCSGFGIMGCVTPEAVEKTLAANPDAAGVLLTRPNYYGICCDLTGIAAIVHSYGKILAVDEAHGAHLRFNPALPVCAMDAGADLCVQSAHKTLPAFTQGAYLHVKAGRVDIERLEFMLDILQTTSPSYVIMAFLDIARSLMQHEGGQLLARLLSDIRRSKQEASCLSGLRFLEERDFPGGTLDGTRIVANLERLGVTGYDAQKLLRQDYGIEIEMSDFMNVVAIATTADDENSIDRFFKGLVGVGRKYGCSRKRKSPNWAEFGIPAAGLGLNGALKTRSEQIDLRKAAGRVCRSVIAPYPPGIPLLFPGEIITQEIIGYLIETLECGGAVNGIDGKLRIQVCKNVV